MIPKEVKEALDEMIDLAGFSLEVLHGCDAAAAESMFELLMGNDVAPRKEFISTAEIDRDRIDA